MAEASIFSFDSDFYLLSETNFYSIFCSLFIAESIFTAVLASTFSVFSALDETSVFALASTLAVFDASALIAVFFSS